MVHNAQFVNLIYNLWQIFKFQMIFYPFTENRKTIFFLLASYDKSPLNVKTRFFDFRHDFSERKKDRITFSQMKASSKEWSITFAKFSLLKKRFFQYNYILLHVWNWKLQTVKFSYIDFNYEFNEQAMIVHFFKNWKDGK